MDKSIPAHQERINEELPIILNAIGRDKYWRQDIFFETGCAWLMQQVGYEEYISLATNQDGVAKKAFWNWWRLRWEERDFMFGEQLKKQSISRKEARELYFKYHNLPALCQNGRLCQSFIQILPDLKKKAKNGKKKFALAQ